MTPELKKKLLELAALEDRIRDIMTSPDYDKSHYDKLLEEFQTKWNEIYDWVRVHLR